MLFYFLFSLSLFLNKRRIPILIVALLCLVCSGLLLHGQPSKALVVATSPLLIEFVLGILIARLYASNFSIPLSLALVVGVVGFAVLFVISPACHYDNNLLERLFMWGLPAAAIVFAATQIERRRNLYLPRLAAVGDASYSLYLSHMFVLPVVGRVWSRYGVASNIVFLGVVLTACVLTALISYHWIEVPLIRLATTLFGGRSTGQLDKSVEIVA
jgi:peptidoglycan/LPS O-acetylase OafA/YrhL